MIGRHFTKRSALFLSICAFLFLAVFSHVTVLNAATLELSSGSAQYEVGQTFTARVYVSSSDQPMNGVNVTASFDPTILQAVSVSKAGSIITIWAAEPTISNIDGTVHFEGVTTSGYQGSAGLIATITFKTRQAGTASINFKSSTVLAHDGLGTDITSSTRGTTLSITNPVQVEEEPAEEPEEPAKPTTVAAPSTIKIQSSTHPVQGQWYPNNSPVFTWNLPQGVTAVKLGYDKNSSGSPIVLYDSPISKKTLENLADGEYYFHVAFKTASGWSETAHYGFKIDTRPPEPFTAIAQNAENEQDPRPRISAQARDITSGIDHYEVSIDGSEWVKVTQGAMPYVPAPMFPGNKTIIVRAFDAAKNSTDSKVQFLVRGIDTPQITSYTEKVALDGKFQVEGKTRPNAKVTITLIESESAAMLFDNRLAAVDAVRSKVQPRSQSVKATANGDFILIWDGKLEPGSYSFVAEAEDEYGAMSPRMQVSYEFEIKPDPLQTYGFKILNYTSLIIVVLACVAAIVGVITYMIIGFKRIQRRMRRELQKAEAVVHIEFDVIRDELNRQLRLLERTGSKRELTKEEGTIEKSLTKFLKAREKEIEKAIEKVEKTTEKKD